MFGDFFGGRTSGGRRQARGADVRVDLQLSFPEAVWGVTKDIKVARDVPCGTCSGSGARPASLVCSSIGSTCTVVAITRSIASVTSSMRLLPWRGIGMRRLKQ